MRVHVRKYFKGEYKMQNLSQRKTIRLKDFDYGQNGGYFLTLCIKNRCELLGKINVGSDDPGAPLVAFSEYGKIVDNYINKIENHYGVSVDKYVIMPNHIHMIIIVKDSVPGSSRPTMLIPNIIAALKKMTTKEIGFDLWQTSYHDHIIRNEEEYWKIWKYIDENPAKWEEDKYYKK